MTGGHFILERLLFKGEALPPMPKEQVRRQLALLGPLCAEEKITLLPLVLFLGGAISISWHHISLPWIAGFILVALLLYGLVSKKNFQQYVDWPMVFFLLSLQGLTSTMEHLDLVGQVKPWMDSAAALLKEDVARDFARQAIADHHLNPDELDRLRFLLDESVPVVERLQSRLHPVSSYVVLPIFALANAGVVLGGAVSACLTLPASIAALGLDGVLGPLDAPSAAAFTVATVSDVVASWVTLPFLAVVLVLTAGSARRFAGKGGS